MSTALDLLITPSVKTNLTVHMATFTDSNIVSVENAIKKMRTHRLLMQIIADNINNSKCWSKDPNQTNQTVYNRFMFDSLSNNQKDIGLYLYTKQPLYRQFITNVFLNMSEINKRTINVKLLLLHVALTDNNVKCGVCEEALVPCFEVDDGLVGIGLADFFNNSEKVGYKCTLCRYNNMINDQLNTQIRRVFSTDTTSATIGVDDFF